MENPSKILSNFGGLGGKHPPKTYSSTPSPPLPPPPYGEEGTNDDDKLGTDKLCQARET